MKHVTPAQFDDLGGDGPVTALHVSEIGRKLEEPLRALWRRISPTIEQLELIGQGWIELQELDLAAAPRLRTLTLERVQVAADVLAHPHLEVLTLRECFVGGSSAPVAELQIGPRLRSLSATDSNFHIEHLIADGPEFTSFALHQDEDAAEHSFDRITFRGPKLSRVQHRAEWPTEVCFTGELPALTRSGVYVRAGRYSRPTIDVSGLPEGHPLRGLAG